MSHENIMRLWNDACLLGLIRPKLHILTKTTSYTVTSDDFGSVFTTRGAGVGVTFTLPSASAVNKGEWVMFISVANQNMIVAGATGGLVVFNDLAADNIGYGTSSELIAGAFLAISDGTSWIVLPLGTETQTIGVDTAASTSPSASTSSSTSASASPSASASSTPSASASNTASASPSASVSNTPSSSPSST
jgi:hypothetical protein